VPVVMAAIMATAVLVPLAATGLQAVTADSVATVVAVVWSRVMAVMAAMVVRVAPGRTGQPVPTVLPER
jgi:hypothetical protein